METTEQNKVALYLFNHIKIFKKKIKSIGLCKQSFYNIS